MSTGDGRGQGNAIMQKRGFVSVGRTIPHRGSAVPKSPAGRICCGPAIIAAFDPARTSACAGFKADVFHSQSQPSRDVVGLRPLAAELAPGLALLWPFDERAPVSCKDQSDGRHDGRSLWLASRTLSPKG